MRVDVASVFAKIIVLVCWWGQFGTALALQGCVAGRASVRRQTAGVGAPSWNC